MASDTHRLGGGLCEQEKAQLSPLLHSTHPQTLPLALQALSGQCKPMDMGWQ